MNEIIKIVESLGKSSLLNDGATETVKHEIRKKKVGLWACGLTNLGLTVFSQETIYRVQKVECMS